MKLGGRGPTPGSDGRRESVGGQEGELAGEGGGYFVWKKVQLQPNSYLRAVSIREQIAEDEFSIKSNVFPFRRVSMYPDSYRSSFHYLIVILIISIPY